MKFYVKKQFDGRRFKAVIPVIVDDDNDDDVTPYDDGDDD